MFFEVKRRDLAGRIGRLFTRHGVLETPIVLPVVDPARQVPELGVISKVGFNGIITNAYLFYKRNHGVVKNIHSELNWDNVIMTDSGGYQILVYGDIDVDNKTVVEYEKAIGSDIAVILDIPTGSKMSREDAEKAVLETYKRGLESLPLIEDSEQLWVYPVQGAPYIDLLRRSSKLATRLPYHIYAAGSPTVMLEKYKYAELVEIVATVRVNTPLDRPLHVFGVGHPMIIPFLVAVGADMFDSASYVLYARDGRYLVEDGTRNIRELEYFPCSCPVCSKYTPRDLLEAPRYKREELLALHNLYVLYEEIKRVKQAIKENRLWEMLEWRAHAHPSLREAFSVLLKYLRFLEKLSPRVNPGGKALLVVSEFSQYNPKVLINAEGAGSLLSKQIRGKLVIILPAYKKPYTTQSEYRVLSETCKECKHVKIVFLHPVLGLIPPELTSTYPFYQHESRILKNTISFKALRNHLKPLIEGRPSKVIVLAAAWLRGRIAEKISEAIKTANIEAATCKLNEASSLIHQ
ncbi:MAG: tRNA guanosine(15) transglycosylase TgtA [Desulfurococcaceae archaeon]|nr:tRNA guanosine(15) transglycosylase TgtA [Desulfurococcaceae archaeon]MCC6052723.1 tRNA guanosine(15) transglycosylase TgtA [Desulfurococcaceae archaeon]